MRAPQYSSVYSLRNRYAKSIYLGLAGYIGAFLVIFSLSWFYSFLFGEASDILIAVVLMPAVEESIRFCVLAYGFYVFLKASQSNVYLLLFVIGWCLIDLAWGASNIISSQIPSDDLLTSVIWVLQPFSVHLFTTWAMAILMRGQASTNIVPLLLAFVFHSLYNGSTFARPHFSVGGVYLDQVIACLFLIGWMALAWLLWRTNAHSNRLGTTSDV